MNENLLHEFLEDEYDSDIRHLLLATIQESKSSPELLKRDFAFNRFNVVLNFEFRRVLIEDDLTVGEQGECEIEMEEFEEILKK